jgi:hypothetical protein
MPTDIYGYDCCPIYRLNYTKNFRLGCPRPSSSRLYGLEVEMDNFDEYEAEEADTIWNWLQDEVLGVHIADAYYLPTDDGSIRSRGGTSAELKTVPLTKTEHTLYHWLFTRKQTKSNAVPTTYRHALREMVGVRRRWFPTGGAWTNRTCGMHITVSDTGASRLTWCKVLYWINRIASFGMHKTLFLREPTSYCNVQSVQSRTYNGSRWKLYGEDIKAYNSVREAFASPSEYDEEAIESLLGYEKYSQLRVKPGELVEFRGFRSSLNPLMMLRNIEVVESIIDLMEETPLYRLDSTTDQSYGFYVGQNHHKYPFLRRWFVDVAKNSPMRKAFIVGSNKWANRGSQTERGA